MIGKEFGPEYVPEKPRLYQTKAKNAQEAHEAIRPTDLGKHPDTLRHIDPDQHKLYQLIWRRALASQMRSAEIERTTADIDVATAGRAITLRAVGSVITFPGFLGVYGVEKTGEDDEDSRELPALTEGDTPALEKVDIEQHFTQPPARYTEASLIKKMEDWASGASTYAATLGTLKDRDYIRLEKRALIPEDRGRLVTAFLQSFFTRYVEYGFTAGLEEELDEISAGEIDYKEVLRRFWKDFSHQAEEIKDLRVSEVLDANDLLRSPHLPAKEAARPACPTCGTGQLSLKPRSALGRSNY